MSETGIVFIGAGRTGTVLCRMFAAAGLPVTGIASRNAESSSAAASLAGIPDFGNRLAEAASRAGALFLTVPDAVIGGVGSRLRKAVKKGTIVMHCSGALSSDILAGFRGIGASVGSLHPLRSFASPDCDLPCGTETAFYFEGDSAAKSFAKQVTQALGAPFYEIQTQDKALYHAAAVISSNFLVALEYYALRCLEKAGIRRPQGLASLLPLIQSTVDNMSTAGVPGALTGPVERSDTETIRKHLEAMKRSGFPTDLYVCAAHQALQAAAEKHANHGVDAVEISAILNQFRGN